VQQSNTVVQDSFSLGQAFAAMGILVGLAITVPLMGIMMIPGLVLGVAARGLKEAAAEALAPNPERGAPSVSAAPRHLATPSLGAGHSPCAPETSP
jgi:hypothetical protein